MIAQVDELDWYHNEENVLLTAGFLVDSGATGAEVFQYFQRPWEYTEKYYEAKFELNSFLEEIEGL